MTDPDISPEAVDILIAVWEMGGLQQSELHLLTDTCRAQSAALTQSRAETAAAYERAAEMIREYPHFMLMTPDQKKVCVHLAQVIRALATPDQSSALAVLIAEAEARGMRKAAALARQALVDGAYIKRGSHQETPSSVMFLAETLVSNAILAAIPQGDTTND